jgi:hypothetical protein
MLYFLTIIDHLTPAEVPTVFILEFLLQTKKHASDRRHFYAAVRLSGL